MELVYLHGQDRRPVARRIRALGEWAVRNRARMLAVRPRFDQPANTHAPTLKPER